MSRPAAAVPRRPIAATCIGLTVAVVALASCSDRSSTTNATGSSASSERTTTRRTTTASFFDEATVHSIAVKVAKRDYDGAIADYRENGEKSWVHADVTIDGHVYRDVGMRLKGNSSLFGIGGRGPGGVGGGPGGRAVAVCIAGVPADAVPVGGGGGFGGGGPGGPGGPGGNADADKPETLPWLIRLDKFEDGQQHQGHHAFVVRSSNSTTALNELLALDLLEQAGLATQQAAVTRFSVNGSDEIVRLVIENLNDDWQEETFGGGLLYKADASGDYSYRGKDPDSYAEAWDQEAGDDDLSPLISFLDFVNNASDADFAAHIGQRLDLNAFARYMAFEDLIQNGDDIAGPGNNSYLHYDPSTKRMTVVAWDHNLTFRSGFGGFGGGPVGFPGAGAGAAPGADTGTDLGGLLATPGTDAPASDTTPTSDTPSTDTTLPACDVTVAGRAGGDAAGRGLPGGFGRSNALVDRLASNPAYTRAYDAALAQLRAQLYTSGAATKALSHWSAVIEAGASDLVDAATVESESKAIADVVAG